MQVLRNLAVLEHQGQFDQSGDARCRLQVTDIGFDRAYPTLVVFAAALPDHLAEGVGFDGIAHRGAGAVGFYVGHPVGSYSGVLVGGAQHSNLRRKARHGEALFGVAVLVDGRTQDGGVDRVAVGLGLRQWFQNHHAAAFAAHVAVGPAVEGFAVAVRRQEVALRHHHRRLRPQDGVHPARDGLRAFTVPDALASQVHPYQ